MRSHRKVYNIHHKLLISRHRFNTRRTRILKYTSYLPITLVASYRIDPTLIQQLALGRRLKPPKSQVSASPRQFTHESMY